MVLLLGLFGRGNNLRDRGANPHDTELSRIRGSAYLNLQPVLKFEDLEAIVLREASTSAEVISRGGGRRVHLRFLGARHSPIVLDEIFQSFKLGRGAVRCFIRRGKVHRGIFLGFRSKD